MDRDQVRAALLAKIEATWPRFKDSPDLARLIELGSNDDLRKHLAWAEAAASIGAEEPREWLEPSPRIPAEDAELMRRVLSSRTGNEMPPNCYVLASEECSWYAGPKWVPFNIWQQSVYEGRGTEVRECALKLISSAGAESLWAAIASRYSRPDAVSINLAVVCADAKANWASIPRLTPSKFKEHREELARRAEQLALELERFYLPRDPDEYEFPGLLDFTDLMNQEERDRLDQAIRATTARIANRARKEAGIRGMDWAEYNSIGDKARALGYRDEDLHTLAQEDATEVYALMLLDHTNYNTDWYGGVPTLPNMLRRIAKKFEVDGSDPPLKNPNLTNAERNFFARFLCKYFWTSFGLVSPSIVRDIVAIFYEQGIDENDVSQMVSKVKSKHPLP